MFLPPLRAHLVLLVVYVANISAAPPINVPPDSSFAITSTPGPTFSGGSVNDTPGYTTNLRANAFDPQS